jgi:hypothetical protein
MKYFPLLCSTLLAWLSLPGCASLTKSQLNQINSFGQLTKNFSDYPGKVVSSYNRCYLQDELLAANAAPTPEAHYKAIQDALNFKEQSDIISRKIDLSLQIIDQYAQALVLLTSNRHSLQLDSAATKVGSSLDGLLGEYNKLETAHQVPSGIGGTVSALITLGGDTYIRSKQANDIKVLVPQGDILIGQMADNILHFLQDPLESATDHGLTLEYLIKAEKDNVGINYTRYLKVNWNIVTLKQKETVVLSGTIQNNRFASLAEDQACLQLLADLDLTETLRKQCISAVTNLRKAHAQLLEDVKSKKKLKEIVAGLQSYADDVKKMYSTVKAIK